MNDLTLPTPATQPKSLLILVWACLECFSLDPSNGVKYDTLLITIELRIIISLNDVIWRSLAIENAVEMKSLERVLVEILGSWILVSRARKRLSLQIDSFTSRHFSLSHLKNLLGIMNPSEGIDIPLIKRDLWSEIG